LQKQVQIDTLTKNIASAKNKIAELEKEIAAAKSGREESVRDPLTFL